jgi:PAS domain S-box-containing protein
MIFSKRTAVSSLAPELIARILETLDALVVVLDPEGRILLFNRKCQDLTGYKESDVKGRLMWDLLVPERVRPDARSYFAELTSGHFSASHVIPWLLRDGTERTISWMSSTVPDKKGKLAWVIATGLDTTEHQGEREELSRMTSIANYDPAPALVLDRQGRILYANPAAQQILAKGRLAGETWKKVCPGLNDPAYDRFLRSPSPQRYTSEAKLNNRSYVFEHLSVPDQGMALVFGFDATELREAQSKAQDAEKAFQEFAEGSALGFYLTDAKGQFVTCNQAFERMFGYRRTELVGKSVAKLRLFPRRMAAVLQSNSSRYSSGKGTGFEEFEMLCKNGKHVLVSIAITPMMRNGKLELMSVAAEAGDRKQLEKELSRVREQLRETDSELKERIELTKELIEKQGKAGPAVTAQLNQSVHNLTSVIRNSVFSLELLALPDVEVKVRKHLADVESALARLDRIGIEEPPSGPGPEAPATETGDSGIPKSGDSRSQVAPVIPSNPPEPGELAGVPDAGPALENPEPAEPEDEPTLEVSEPAPGAPPPNEEEEPQSDSEGVT